MKTFWPLVMIGIAELTNRRIGFAFDIRERGSNRLICEAAYRVACVDARSFSARTFPDEVLSLLAPAVPAEAKRG